MSAFKTFQLVLLYCKEMPVSKRVFQLKHLCWRLVSPECTLSTSRLQRSRCKTRAGSSKSKTKPPAAFLLLVSTTAFVICLLSWLVLVLVMVLVLPESTTALCYSSVNCWRPSSPPVIRCGPKVIEATWRRQSRIGDKKWGIIRCLCRPWLDGPSRNISSSKSKAAFTISIQWTQRIKDILSWMWILLCILQVVMIVLRRIWWWYLDQMQAKGAKEAPTVWTLIKKQKRFSPPAMPRLLCLLLILTSKTLVSRVSNFFWPSPSGSDSHSQSASSSPSAPVFLWSFLGITYFLLRPLKRSVPISTRVQVPSALQGTLCLVSNQCIFILCFPLSPASIFENLAEWKALFLHSLDINNWTK